MAAARRHWSISVILLAMLVNALLHDARVGYDAGAHRDYAVTLSRLALPTPVQSSEFFSPPLAYAPPAVLLALHVPMPVVTKAWQVLQVIYAGVLLLHLAWLFEATRSGRTACIAGTVALLSAAVWWRSFAMIRPEALLAALVMAASYHTVRLTQGDRPTWRFIVAGALWGAACLTRQWGIFALLAVLPCSLLAGNRNRRWWAGVAKAAAVCTVIAAPFYLSLLYRFGTVRPFNRPASTDSHLHWTWNPIDAARHPFSRGQIDRPLNILYADTFGDYWMYFLARGQAPGHKYLVGTPLIDAIASPATAVPNNVQCLTPYLRAVLIVSVPVTILGLLSLGWTTVACVWTLTEKQRSSAADFLVPLAAFVGTVAGYAWFVWSYAATTNDTDTVKATYLLQALPFAALFVGIFVKEVHARHPMLGRLIVGLLVLTLCCNAGTFWTRCIAF